MTTIPMLFAASTFDVFVQTFFKALALGSLYSMLALGFVLIFKATQTSSNKIIKIALWSIWLLFFLLLLNKTMQLFYINQNITYATGTTLALLHLYNLRYCQCENDKCCAKIN